VDDAAVWNDVRRLVSPPSHLGQAYISAGSLTTPAITISNVGTNSMSYTASNVMQNVKQNQQ